MNTAEKLKNLREVMQKKGIDAFIVFSADPHASEYLPTFWQERAWISGFTGSAGFAVITAKKAGVWTDSRYFVQAASELENSGFTLFKEGVEGTPDYISWLLQELENESVVAVNGLCTSHNSWRLLENKLQAKNIRLEDNSLLNEIWINRPEDRLNPIFIHSEKYAGKSSIEKIADIRKEMKLLNSDFHIVTTLDDVAWITNLRGSDVAYNPVFLSYLVLTNNETILFTNLQKCNEEVKKYVSDSGILLLPYDNFFTYLSEIQQKRILISGNANQLIFKTLAEKNIFIEAEPPSQLQKARKNNTELEGFRIAMRKDGVAMVNFLYWLENNVGKQEIDEYSLGRILEKFRSEQPNFVGNSFGEIIGYQGNGAIVHYSADEKTAKKITNYGSVLIDSGGQYREGTTDITRVVPLGEISSEFKKDYTLVLKGMINLSLAEFSKGTRGVQLDALARLPLWLEGRDYGHGTGHGVGSFLNVHEGPQNIRKDLRDIPLEIGMVCSNEPGLYRENKYGIRIENLIAVKKVRTTEFGDFYGFETLTLCPINTKCIEVSLLTDREKAWLNAYHQQVKNELFALLEIPQQQWLEKACERV